MQINTLWIRPLAQRTGLPEATVRDRLINDACFNVATAGAIVRLHLNEENGDLLRAVGAYHSRTPARSEAYQSKVLSAAQQLFAMPSSPLRPKGQSQR